MTGSTIQQAKRLNFSTMKNNYKKITLLTIFIFLNFITWGQDAPPLKTLYLKDGSFLLGHMIAERRDSYHWELTDGTQIIFQKDQVRLIEDQRDNFFHLKKGKIKRIRGFYGSLMVGQLFEKKINEWIEPDHATSINVAVGYQLNPKYAVGVGTGYDIYETPVIPLFLNFHGDLLNSTTTPYYRLSAGYGFTAPTKDQKENQSLDQNGGILLHPSIGLKFHTRSNLAMLIDFGYRFQRYNRQFIWDVNPQRWTLQRASLRIGIEF